MSAARTFAIDAKRIGGESAGDWFRRNSFAVEEALTDQGHVLVKGLDVTTVPDVARVRIALTTDPAPYDREETSPRTAYGDGVFSSTDLPATQTIRLHNEDSYSAVVPARLIFACAVAPDRGGATTVADLRQVLRALPSKLLDEFWARGWLVERHFHPHIGMSWQDAFGVADRQGLEAVARRQGITLRWYDDGVLRTSARRPAFVLHPVTKEEVWFNHVAVFNFWTLDVETREILASAYEDRLPLNTAYGDGSPIPQGVVDELNAAYDYATVRTPWEPGDVMVIDNLLAAHGRDAFEGPRKVMAALGNPLVVGDWQPHRAAAVRPLRSSEGTPT